MARDGNGNYVLPAGQPVATGTAISSTVFNNLTTDLQNALTQSVSADGQTPITGALKAVNGTNGAASYAFTASPGSGLYSPATDQAAIAAGGVQVAKFAAGATTFTGTLTGGTYNKITITVPATGATLTLADGSTLATSGAYSTTFTATGATTVTLPTTGTLATLAGSEALTNKTVNKWTLTAPTTSATLTAGADNCTYTLPGVTSTLASLAGTEELTNKTLTSSVAKGTWTTSGTWTIPAHTVSGAITYGGVTLSNAVTGTGNMVLSASPTLTGTPVINTTASVGGTWSAAATWTLPAFTLGGAITGNSQNVSGIGTFGCGAITSTGVFSATGITTTASGINSTAIGATTPSTASFTTLSASGIATYSGSQQITAVNKGSINNATVTFDWSAANVQYYTATGATVTWAFSNIPASGTFGEMLIVMTNQGLYTLAAGTTVNWELSDGTYSTSFSTYLAQNTGRTALKNSGVDMCYLWTTLNVVYGKLV